MCEIKAKTGKCHVDAATHQLWKGGGEGREWLEIALTEVLDKLGPSQKNEHKKLRVPSPSSSRFCYRFCVKFCTMWRKVQKPLYLKHFETYKKQKSR